jgi:hypothetical protein
MVRLLRFSRAIRFLSSLLFAAAVAWPAFAQDPRPVDAQAPAHISLVDGVAVLERDGQIDDDPSNMPLLAGDRIRTRSGRVEVLFADGSTLHLDRNTVVDLQSDDLLRLIDGRIRLSIPGPSRSVSYRIDGAGGWAQIFEPGDYRVAIMHAAGNGELELAVMRGRAELANEDGQTPLRAGERAFVRTGSAPSYAYVANSAAMDAFDRWSEARRDERMTASAEYLPSEVQPYAAAFERYGYWGYEPSYGRVWYPRVAVGWRPYYHGRWVSLRPYGWTWIAHDPWGWPTHHYGRWGISGAGGWFWIPGRSWGAAWVSWASAPGYVSWCPLGWDNRPIFSININVGGHRHYDPWRAWTVVPRQHFGAGFVHRRVVAVSHLDYRVLSSFTTRDRAPEIIGRAVPRSAAPIRVAGTAAGRRGHAPLYTNVPADRGRVQTDGARIRVPDAARADRDRPAEGVARERAVPTRPAVRSDRSFESDQRPASGARPNAAPAGTEAPANGSAEPSSRRVESPGARRRIDAPPASASTDPRRETRPGVAVPRSTTPDRGYVPAPNRSSGSPAEPSRSARPREEGLPSAPPARTEAPVSGRPGVIERVPSPSRAPDGGTRPSRSYETGPRAVPRGDGGPPSGVVRPPAPSRGPERAPAGSMERSGPAAQPSARPSGGGGNTGGGNRQAAPPSGARPRPGGGG